jgi:hypothetical protein
MGKATRTKRTRRSAGSTSHLDSEPSLTPILQQMVRAARELLTIRDPLEAEMWASSLLGMFDGLELIGEDPLLFFGRALVRHAAGSDRPESLALLLALSAVAPGEVAKPARTEAARLGGRGVPSPNWAEALGRAEFVEAHLITHPLGGQDALLAAFRHPGWPVHGFSILVDHDVLGGAVKDAFAVDPYANALACWRATPDFSVESIGPAELAGRVREAFAMADMYTEVRYSENCQHARPLLMSRIDALPDTWEPPEPQELPEAARSSLVEAFLASPEAKALSRRARTAAGEVAEILVDFRCNYGDGEALRWNDVLVEVFLCDWYPRKVAREVGFADRVPEVLRGWIRHGARERGLPASLIDEALGAVGEFEEEFRIAVNDPSRFGMAKSLVLAMQQDGVDLTDQQEVAVWIDRFNARPIEQRIEVVG